jgi:type IV pilus modification protein PilV
MTSINHLREMNHMWIEKKKLSTQRGFTLIEVLMAMVILGVGIMSIVALVTRDITYNNSSRRQTQGYTWAMERVEHLRSIPYADVVTDTATQGPYSVQWTVTDNSANVDGTKLVDVVVQWNGRDVANLTFTRSEVAM